MVVRRQPSLPKNSRRLAIRGVATITRLQYGKMVVKAWPKKRPGPPTANQQIARDMFAGVAAAIKSATPEEIAGAREMAEGTAYTYKDILTACAYGTFWTFYKTDGTAVHGVRVMASSIQAMLDSLGMTVGSMLYRSTEGWVILEPGSPGQVLTPNAARTALEWADFSSSGGGGVSLFDGDLNVNHTQSLGSGWTILVSQVVPAGATISGVAVYGAAAAAAATLSSGLYDDNVGPVNLLASGSPVTGFATGINAIDFDTPYTSPSDQVVWFGFNVEDASITTVQMQKSCNYKNIGSHTWSDPAPSGFSVGGSTSWACWLY